jgi:hypothetical protein
VTSWRSAAGGKFEAYSAFALDRAERDRVRRLVAALGDLADVTELGEVLAAAPAALQAEARPAVRA